MDNKEKEERFLKARNSVFRLLNFRLRSEGELREKLAEKSLPIPVIEQTIQYFKDLGLVDDRVFAKQWTASRLKKPFGINRIRLELRKKGISAEIIQETLKEATGRYNELEIVTELANNRALKYKDCDPEKIQQRVYGYLSRRGFSTNTIIKAVKKLSLNSNPSCASAISFFTFIIASKKSF